MPEALPDYKPPTDLLQGRIVLITGAADGIGRAVCRACAAHGASLVMLDRKSRKLEILYDEITDRGWPEPTLVVQDLEQLDSQRAADLAAGIAHDFGRLDGLLHNAGVLDLLTPLHSYPLDLWRRTMQVNLTAPYLLTQALVPLLKLSESASVIFTSADVGRRGRAYWGAYAAAYAAIENLVQTWADELEANTSVRMNSIDPGAVRTALRNAAYPGELAGSLKAPDDIVNAYLYLLGDDSRGVRGRAFSL